MSQAPDQSHSPALKPKDGNLFPRHNSMKLPSQQLGKNGTLEGNKELCIMPHKEFHYRKKSLLE